MWFGFVGASALSVSHCFANENPRDVQLKNAIRDAVLSKWQEGLNPGEKIGASAVENARAPAVVDAVAMQSVRCYRQYASGFASADVASFEKLIAGRHDLFETRDWEHDVESAIDSRYGAGASLLKNSCTKKDSKSRECKISNSYGVIWGKLYIKFYGCILEHGQKIPEMLKSGVK